MDVLTYEDFSSKKGDEFLIFIENSSPLSLVLTDITTKSIGNFPGKIRDPFSLFFTGTKNVYCPQGIYRLRHGTDWMNDIFLVPIGDNPDGTFLYQAVFN